MNIKLKKDTMLLLILVIFCLITFFSFLGSYPLIDVDETRYVRIAQEMINGNNYLTPTINGEIFLEKPPLFFWLEDISMLIFGVNEWAARIPMAFIASFGVFFVYFTGKHLVSSRFGFISALALGSGALYIGLSNIAILDLLLSVTMMIATYFGIMTIFSEGKQNWFQWCGFYIFSALSALSKGLPGLIVPFMVVFAAYLVSKKLKTLFDFRKIGLGVVLMLLILLPWHIMMYKVHGQAFIDEYIIKHHIARFVNSVGINRKEPWYFFIPVIFVGFVPFIFTILNVFIKKIKDLVKTFRSGFKFNIFDYFMPDVPISRRFLGFNIIAFLLIFLFFSSSSTKLMTYILPIVFPLAFITGYIFEEYLENNKFEIQIKISNKILSTITLIISVALISGLILSMNNMPLRNELPQGLRLIMFLVFILCLSYSIFNFYHLFKKSNQKHYFVSSVVFMMIATVLLKIFIFNFAISLGQNELIDYAKYAKENKLKLATFDFGYRYSTIFYYGNHVEMNKETDYNWFNDKLNNGYVIILKNKNMVTMPYEVKYKVIESGKKYTLVKKEEE